MRTVQQEEGWSLVRPNHSTLYFVTHHCPKFKGRIWLAYNHECLQCNSVPDKDLLVARDLLNMGVTP